VNFKKYIQQFSAAFLLFIFTFAATPKRFLHAAFANHNDDTVVKSTNHFQQSISNQTYQCQIDNLVVELPFFGSTTIFFQTFILHVDKMQEQFVFVFLDNNDLVDSLRGPPIFC
jgi:hypothetical protein